MRHEKEEYLSAREAAKRLGVTVPTVHALRRRKQLKAVRRKGYRGRKQWFILGSSITPKVFQAKCLHCGKVFASKQASRAKFCCRGHAATYHRRRYAKWIAR